MTFDPVAFFDNPDKRLVGGEWTVKGSNLELVSYIEATGLVSPDVQLLGLAELNIADARVLFQVQLLHGPGPLRPLSRIEWRPLKGHTNRKIGADKRLHYKVITGSHVHSFRKNWVASEGRMVDENLPVADELPTEPKTFAELIAFAADEFRIPNMVELPTPPWEPLLRMQ
jgi:hypothetical protein